MVKFVRLDRCLVRRCLAVDRHYRRENSRILGQINFFAPENCNYFIFLASVNAETLHHSQTDYTLIDKNNCVDYDTVGFEVHSTDSKSL